MTDVSLQLLKKIYWYKPKSWQRIVIPKQFIDEIYRIDVGGQADTVCGIPISYDSSLDEVEVKLEFPRDKSQDRPNLPLKVLCYKTVGAIGYSMDYLRRGDVSKKKKINKMLKQTCYDLIDYLEPSKLITSLNWGFDLVLAYATAKREAKVELTVPRKDEDMICEYWDEESRLMAGELLTEMSIPVIPMDTTYLCDLYALEKCDIFVVQRDDKDNKVKFMLKVAKAANKPVIQVTI